MSAVAADRLAMTAWARQAIASQIRGMTGSNRAPPLAFLEPLGDPGLFGPASVTWRVHAHLVSMLVGGLSSLIIQALHPGALAGVWDHSSFRQDLRARLGRTAFFIAATTYGSRAMAGDALNRVNTIHEQVHGTRPDGKPYRARDPNLLRWVHLAEVLSFLHAYRRFGEPSLPLFEQNQYIREMQRIGNALGANNLPDSVAQAQADLLGYQDELVIDNRVREVLSLIEAFPSRKRDRPFVRLIVAAAFEQLPDWVLALLGRTRAPRWQAALNRQALVAASIPIDWALATEGVSAYAKRRVAG